MAYEASPVPGDILVTGTDAVSTAPAVFRVDKATGAQAIVSSGNTFTSPGGIAVEASGSIVVTDSGTVAGRGEVRVDPASGSRTVVSTGGGFVSPIGVAVEADGRIVVADANAFGSAADLVHDGGVIRVDPETGTQTKVSAGGGFVSPRGIVVAADGSILVTDSEAFGGGGGVIRVDPVTGAHTTVASGGALRSPRQLAVVPTTGS